MLQTVEVEIDIDGSVKWLEPLHLSKRSRGYVTILPETNGASQSKGKAAATLKFLRENRLPDAVRPSIEEIEAQIAEARESVGLRPLHVYLDSCLVIYLVEEHPIFAPVVEALLAKTPDIVLHISGCKISR